MKTHLQSLALAGLAAVAIAMPSTASAGVIPLNVFVTGSGFEQTPTGTVTITDIGQNVRVDFSVDQGDLSALFFNLVAPFDFADLSLSNVSTSPGSPGATLLDGPQAPSNLDFDFGVDFGRGSGGGNVVRSGSFVLALDGFDLSQPAFYQQSTNSGGTSVTVGAKLQSLGRDGNGSATIGGNPGGTPVPAPAGFALFLAGLGALVISRRRQAT